jgi:predicted ester cyclase
MFDQNKAALRRGYEAIGKGNAAVFHEYMAPNYVFHGPGGLELKGPEGFGQYVTMLRAAFPDMHMAAMSMVSEGDYVAHRATFTGTHRGDFRGIAPTGKRVTFAINILSRFAGGKEVEAWEEFDTLGLYQQLGVAPPMGQTGT